MVSRFRATLTLLLIALTILASLAGCSRPQSFRGTIVLWAPDTQPTNGGPAGYQSIRDRLQAFETAHPGVNVTLVGKAEADIEGPLDQAWLSGQGPDVAYAPFNPAWALAGRLQNLDGLMPADTANDFLPNTLDAARLGGHLYGVPSGAEPVLLILNLDVFDRRHASPPADGRWTVAEFDATLHRIAAPAAGTEPATYGLGYYVLPGFYEFWPLWAAGPGLTDSGTGALTPSSPERIDQLTRLAAGTQAPGLLWPGSARKDPQELWQSFIGPEATVAMAPWTPWPLPLLTTGKYQTRYAVAHFPTAAAGSQPATTGIVHTYLLRRQDDPLKAKAALDLALFLTSADAQREQALHSGILPVRGSAGNPFPNDPNLTRAVSMVAEMQPLPFDRQRRQAMDQLQQRVQYAALGALTPAAALTPEGATP
ncbi:MAG: extracellular solute-binding protein [Symbiobacteriia bacterium]